MEAGAIGPQEILDAQESDKGVSPEMRILQDLENKPADTSAESEKTDSDTENAEAAEGKKEEKELPKVANQDQSILGFILSTINPEYALITVFPQSHRWIGSLLYIFLEMIDLMDRDL